MALKLRDFGDIEATRRRIYENVKKGFENREFEGNFTKLKIKDVEIPERNYGKREYKMAKLKDLTLTTPVKGTVQLYDKKTGKLLGERRMVLAQLPYLTRKFGTFISNGTDFSVANQMRLLPGVYTKFKQDGNIESQFNTEGVLGFRIQMDPETGRFKLVVGGNKLNLYPILRKIGISDEQLINAWGKNLWEVNKKHSQAKDIDRFYKKLYGYDADSKLDIDTKAEKIKEMLPKLKLDPEVTKITLGKEYRHVTPESMLRATQKILRLFKGIDKPDDRESLLFKSFHGVEDFLKERIDKDAGGIGRRLAKKLDKHKDLSKIPSSYFTPYLNSIVKGDSRAFVLEEINPLQNFDNLHRVIVLGEGGISSIDLVSMDSRNVHPTQYGTIDPVRGPESEKIGIDTRVALNTYKGDDKKFYTRVINAKTKKEEYLSPAGIYNHYVAFPLEMEKKGDKVVALYKGEFVTIPKSKVEYYLESPNEMFSVYSNLVPAIGAIQGNRLLMAGKALADTLPLKNPEAPIVRSAKTVKTHDDDLYPAEDFETYYGKKALAEISPEDGVVTKVEKDRIEIKDKHGKKHKIDLFQNYFLARKTSIHEEPVVSPGQKVRKGQTIARSNFTDKDGTLAVGAHALTVYMPLGETFEDGIILSQSAAENKFASVQTPKHELPLHSHVKVDKKFFTAQFPGVYHKDQIKHIDHNGLPKVGAKVKKGDPLVLAVKSKTISSMDGKMGKLHKNITDKYENASLTWDEEHEGEVVQVQKTKKKVKVIVKTVTPAQVGDKLTGRHGNKGTVAAVWPDWMMPRTKDGRPAEMIVNMMGVISRINPAQIAEGLLGKIGYYKNLIYRLPSFLSEKFTDFVKRELKKHKVPDVETLIHPTEGEFKALVTYPYFYKLSHLAESKLKAREISSYTSDLQPLKGKVQETSAGLIYSEDMLPVKGKKPEGNAIMIGADLLTNLLGHNARNNLREITLIKGQKNDDFWRALRLGYPLPTPDTPFIYKKFENLLRAAGADVKKKGNLITIAPLTNKDIEQLSHGEITKPTFLNGRTLEPEKGGFFDPVITGGPNGEKWAHIKLPEAPGDPKKKIYLPNPIMEQPIKTILGLNQNEFEDVLAGRKELNGLKGPIAIREALKKVDVVKEIEKLKKEIPKLPATHKDNAIKKLKYLIGIRNSGKPLHDIMLDKIPVAPPTTRFYSVMGGGQMGGTGKGVLIVDDLNKLYSELFWAKEGVQNLLNSGLDIEHIGDDILNLYKSFKAVAGLDEAVSTAYTKVPLKGAIKKIVGDKPKTGMFFKKMMSKTQDLSARGVAVPDPTLDLDEIGIPEDIAWKVYAPFVIRKMVQNGYKALAAHDLIQKRDPKAKQFLEKVMEERPILMNRAPSLHRFNIMAFKPKLRKHKAIATNTYINGPYNLDYDGDALQLFVPVTEEAVKEAYEKMLPSKNLFSMKTLSVHYVPSHENIYGGYLMTRKKGKKKNIKVKDTNELLGLLRQGKVGYHDVVQIEKI